jgi:tricorn protease interacting factor F2/3
MRYAGSIIPNLADASILEEPMPNFVPEHYDLLLRPNLYDFRFSGTVQITGSAAEALDRVTLNILELAIWRCEVQRNGLFESCLFYVDPAKEELQIRLPAEMHGELMLQIDYEGLINDKMAGFYRSRYRKDGIDRYIAVTQFEESDARRAFPCADHPSCKATFDVSMIVDNGLTAISNSLPISEDPAEPGKRRVRFERTPKMSTYLLFFGVGEFEIVQDREDRRVRVVTVPGMSSYADYGRAFGRRALKYCEQYYRIPYPLRKMDLIAIPDFAFGAMENWGAITFRENLLLHFPNLTSKAGEERICEVIAHEIAHQWFGNLVTPSDWRYLWLNESFATFFGYGVVDHYHPDWGIWEQFVSAQTDTALVRDALHETFAIEIPGGEHVVINTSTAPIIYSKGGSILRQIQGYIGPDLFRDGLNRYLNNHAYANAASRDLWQAFETASEKPVTRMMQSWIEQPGYPLLSVERQGRTLTLSQKRFTYLPNDSDQLWDIPVNISSFTAEAGVKTLNLRLNQKHMRVELEDASAPYKVNAGQTGFYRVRYLNPDDLEKLGKMAAARTLAVEDRWGLQNDLFAMVKSVQISMDEYLDFLEYYRSEAAFLPLSSITEHLYEAGMVLEGVARKRVAEIGKTLLEQALDKIGYDPAPAEPFTTSLLRDQILRHAVGFGSETAAGYASEQFERLRRGDEVHADILKSVLQVGAHVFGESAFDWLRQRFQDAESEHERMNILYAIGSFSRPDLIEKALRFVLDEVPDRNKFIPIAAAADNHHAVGLMWDWYVTHLAELERFHPLLYERVIAGIVPVAGLQDPSGVKRFFEDYLKQRPQVKDVVRLSLERLEINLRMREFNQKGSA